MTLDQSPDPEQPARRGKHSSKTSASSGSPPKAAPAKGKSKATVCDHCRYRKISCDLRLPCSGCVFRKRTCTYDGVDPDTRSAKLESIEAEKTAREDAIRAAKEQMGDLLGKVEALAFRLHLDADQLNDLYFKAMQLVDEDKKKNPGLYIPPGLSRSTLPPLPNGLIAATKAPDAPDSPPPAGRTRAATAARAEPAARSKSPPALKVAPLVAKSPLAPKVAPLPILASSQPKARPTAAARPPAPAPDVPRKKPAPVAVPDRDRPMTVVVSSKTSDGGQPTVIHIPASAYATYSPDEPVKRLPLNRPLPPMKTIDFGQGPPPLPPIDLTGRPHNSLLFHFPATAIRSASWMGPPNSFPSVFRKPQQTRYHPYRRSSSDSSSSIEIISP
ncbi:hypothetical protein NBRC10513_005277 [Rhodotorula toruloides]|uniref:BY PROTMAP: gi/472588435/gb/EMS25907.1/ fungal specific transcription factor [Rhodosporidium toruloides NP11] gi/647396227/emb/CDR38251.1/ RHTO0S03e06788g1_1 [Rhodosporidium toruloides] n=2 Tax=Rhodotorula toruloides TaxID=5286 RepID=A0A0K3C7X0_RHOTO